MNNNLNDLTPDILITHNSKTTIIDVYNGTDQTTIIHKLQKYLQVCDDVYVFASGIAVSEQLVLRRKISCNSNSSGSMKENLKKSSKLALDP